MRELPPCPNTEHINLHPLFDEIDSRNDREVKLFERMPDGRYKEKQRWLVYSASILATPVTHFDENEGLINDGDDELMDYAIEDSPDYQMSYMLGDTGLDILICAVCKEEFSWEMGIDKLEVVGKNAGRWE